MDKITKAINRFIPKQQKRIKEILSRVKSKNIKGLDVRKLKNRDDIFRIRKGEIRIIYRVEKNGDFFVLAIERRSDNTYNFS